MGEWWFESVNNAQALREDQGQPKQRVRDGGLLPNHELDWSKMMKDSDQAQRRKKKIFWFVDELDSTASRVEKAHTRTQN